MHLRSYAEVYREIGHHIQGVTGATFRRAKTTLSDASRAKTPMVILWNCMLDLCRRLSVPHVLRLHVAPATTYDSLVIASLQLVASTPYSHGSVEQNPSMACTPRQMTVTLRHPMGGRPGAQRSAEDLAPATHPVGCPQGEPSTIINVWLPLPLVAELDRSRHRLESSIGLKANHGVISRRAGACFLGITCR